MESFDVVAVGDAFVDAFLSIHNPTEVCSYDETTEKLSLHAGAKILVDECDFMLGGNSCNVAVGLSRLGLKTALVAELGDDEFAQKIHHGLEKEHVSLDFAKITQGEASTFSMGIQVQGERTLFVHHVNRKHDLPLEGLTTKWIYLSSMGLEWQPMYERVLSFVKEQNIKLAFNPGSQQMKDGYESFKNVVSVCDILFVNRDEAEEMLYGKLRDAQEKESAESLLFRLQRMGPKMIVLTDGLNGSYFLDGGNIITSQPTILAEKPLGKTGAGDAYASGFLGAVLLGKDIKEAMKWGAHNSRAVVEHIGAQTNLLTKEEMERRIQE
ncbi:MAG TPA: carbohydrate kinase family protein [Patescibacteria group bacterium]|nr:carbohydrate kinase family protein [Patescibacteria group bacterium]